MQKLKIYFLLSLAIILLVIIIVIEILGFNDSPVERIYNFFPVYIVFGIIYLIFRFTTKDADKQPDKTQQENINDVRNSFVNSPEYERFYIINQADVQEIILEELGYYQGMAEPEKEAEIKIAEVNGLTILWFFNKEYFLYYIELITSLQESFKNKAVAYLKNKERQKSYFIYDNQYQKNYNLLPCVTEAGQTGFFPYPENYPIAESECVDADLRPDYPVQKMINQIKTLDILHLNYELIKITPLP